MKIIATETAALPQGHYSQAVAHAGMVFVSMQLPGSPGHPIEPTAEIEEQAESALNNVREILRAADSDLSRALSITIYLASVTDWARVNEVYKAMLGDHRPARGVVPTGTLHRGFKIGVMAVAATND